MESTKKSDFGKTAKQRQLRGAEGSKELQNSFKITSSLANGLTKERVQIQNDLQKISAGKEQLEDLKKIKKVKEAILTPEERDTVKNKAEIKGTGFQMDMKTSAKGKGMIEVQRDSRRQRHIAALKESTKFVDQFYDNFCERRNEIQRRSQEFVKSSNIEIDRHMTGLTDELLLANEITYVNGIWDKVSQQRNSRKSDSDQLRENFDQLKRFQQKGSTGFLNKLRSDLIDIAFLLEPQVDELLLDYRNQDIARYEQEHKENDQFFDDVISNDLAVFEIHYAAWKAASVRFHKLKQQNAIQMCLDRLNSSHFVNPTTRIAIFEEIREEQMHLYTQRSDLLSQLDTVRPTVLTKGFVNDIDEKLRNFNEESSSVFDNLVDKLASDMNNTNEDIDIAEADLLDFMQKNDAELEDGETFEGIMFEKVKPTVERRKAESKTLITNSVKYMEDTEYKMGEICQNVINFYRDFASKLDKNKDQLKATQMNFQVELARCGDHHEEMADGQEADLEKCVTGMQQAIHHVQLNEKLQECFDILDQIQKTWRLQSTAYIKIVHAHPQTMDSFFNTYEGDVCELFKLYRADRREEIQEKLEQETKDKQEKLEAEALKKWEKEQKREEKKRETDDAKNVAAGKGGAAKKAPAKPAGKGKGDDKPQLDVPQLEVPQLTDFSSEGGNDYVRERPISEIAENLMKPQEEEKASSESEEDEKKDEEEPADTPANKKTPEPKGGAKQAPKEQQKSGKDADVKSAEEEEEEEEEAAAEPEFLPNDYMDKAELQPPQDPDGTQTLHEDLVVSHARVVEILTDGLMKTLTWLMAEKQTYQQKVQAEGKELQDKSVEELDENLRKQWPRKGRLEVEVFQERKSQITTHNKKYERQVRTCLDKYNNLEEEWNFCLENIEKTFEGFSAQHLKIKESLPVGKNLAELQGMSRREKDANQTFDENCREAKDLMCDLGDIQLTMLIDENAKMLKGCELFAKGGNYATEEIAWYKKQMDEIDQLIEECKAKRAETMTEYAERMETLLKDPTAEFQTAYGDSIQALAAKEGLGKTYGQPRRLAQERLRAEMTKCEMAQKGVDQLVDKLNDLCQQAYQKYNKAGDFEKEKQSLSIQIRILLVQLNRCTQHYSNHLGGFKGEVRTLNRISYLETSESIELTEEEKNIDETRKEDELQCLGTIGFNNPKDPYVRFPDAISKVDQMCKDLCQKLYTGPNASYLVGPDKIPEYLSIFLEHMKKNAEEFKISMVRQLRTTTLRLEQLCAEVPHAVFFYLQLKYSTLIEQNVGQIQQKFDQLKNEDDAQKQENLRQFRPNLANPANKTETQKLDESENQRCAKFSDLVDDTQMDLLDVEQEKSLEYFTSYLSNVRSLIAVFDTTIYKDDFIMLPGDEIIEKKHKNIKFLTAMDASTDLSRRKTRKFPGLGPSVFKIDFAKLFPELYGASKEDQLASTTSLANSEAPQQDQNEIAAEVEVENTAHHKAIVRARNENYQKFKARFEQSIQDIMSKFDSLRKEEHRFSSYWQSNLKELTVKHI